MGWAEVPGSLGLRSDKYSKGSAQGECALSMGFPDACSGRQHIVTCSESLLGRHRQPDLGLCS